MEGSRSSKPPDRNEKDSTHTHDIHVYIQNDFTLYVCSV